MGENNIDCITKKKSCKGYYGTPCNFSREKNKEQGQEVGDERDKQIEGEGDEIQSLT